MPGQDNDVFFLILLLKLFFFFNLMRISKIPCQEEIPEKDILFIKSLHMKAKSSICGFVCAKKT